MGECCFGDGKNCERVMYLCMGTGVGSAFTDKKRILKGNDGRVPFSGQISKSFSFFGGEFAAECRKRGIKIYLTEDTSKRVIEGLYIRMCKSL